jgi:hypothetical protein
MGYPHFRRSEPLGTLPHYKKVDSKMLAKDVQSAPGAKKSQK